MTSDDLRGQIHQVLIPLQGRQGILIPALQTVQEKFGYLPVVAFDEIGLLVGISANTAYGVASFYSQFRFIKPGEHMIKICLGTACHVRGAMGIVDAIQRDIGISPGKTTDDGKFTMEEVRCLGSCALAPVMVVDEEVFGNLTPAKALDIITKFK